MADETIVIKIEGDTKEFQASVKSAEKTVGKLTIAAGKVRGGLNTAVKGGAVAFGALTAAVGGAIAVYKEQEQAEIKTRATIAATGKAAGLTAEEIFKMASGLQNVTTFGDEAIIGGQNLLLTFRKIGKETFPRATEVMLDLSEAMGTDMKSSAIQLGKALNDPTTGLSALSRVGITFSDQQKEQIKTMQRTGDVAGAQAVILEELENQFGGLARAAAEGTGSIDQTKNILGDLVENVGKAALPFVAFLNKRIKALALSFQDINGPIETFQTALRGMLRVGAVVKATFSTIGGIIGSGLVTALEASSAALDGNFAKALEISKQGFENISEVTTSAATELQNDLAEIDQIGIEKRKTAKELELEKIKELAAAEKQARLLAQEKQAEALRIKNDEEFNAQLEKTREEGEIKSAEELVMLQEKLAQQQEAKEIAAAEELKKQGKHDQAMLKLAQIKDKKDKAATQARLNLQKAYTDTSLQLATNLSNLSVAISGKQNQALFVLQKAAALAQAYISTQLAAVSALAIPPAPNFALAGLAKAAGYTGMAAIAATAIKGFQDGGIVGGTSFTGDNVPARVNSGEMILNSDQQAQLFALANGEGGGGSEVVISLKDGLVDFIEAEVLERRATGVGTI